MQSWMLQDFSYGGIPLQLVEFSIAGQSYLMVFNRIDAMYEADDIAYKSQKLGIEYREQSYNVKFDLKSNFDNDTYYQKPDVQFSPSTMRELGRTIRDLLKFHYANSNAEAYYFVAEDTKLKRFYDRLATFYADELNFIIVKDLGEEGLGYEITTPSYQS
ncbi:MAG: hypothetical protein ACK5MF_11470 [Vibrio sp.]|uniref:hypothetical protein n=1 Tax=Vibrio sp. TaxID=678 RepID=UPI003A8B8304